MKMLGHIKAELKETATIAWWWLKSTTVLVTIIIIILGLIVTMQSNSMSSGDKVIALVVIPFYGFVKGVILGLVVALLAVVAHIAGWAAIIPLLASILSLLLACWLSGDLLSNAWLGVYNAAAAELGDKLPIARVGHPIILLFLVPFLLIKCLSSGAVWSAAAWFIGLTVSISSIGLLSGLFLSSLPTLLLVRSRLAERAQKREGAGK